MSAHKIYGPKGVGALYIRKGVRISNYMHGGAQESRKRAGTENLAGIVGMGKACELANRNIDEHIKQIKDLRDYYIEEVKRNILDIKVIIEPIILLNNNIYIKYKSMFENRLT